MGVELTEVQIPVKVKFFRENDLGHFPGLAAPGDGICLEIRRSEVLFKANWPGIQRIGLVIHPVGGDCVINVGRNDKQLADDIAQKYGIGVAVDRNIELGGLSVYYPSENIYIDYTLDLALEQERKAFVAGHGELSL
mgnify:FL=1